MIITMINSSNAYGTEEHYTCIATGDNNGKLYPKKSKLEPKHAFGNNKHAGYKKNFIVFSIYRSYNNK